jgi:hypothetical protein
VVSVSSHSTAEKTLEATVEVQLTTVDQLLTGTPTQAGSGHNQLWIGDLSFMQERCRTAAPLALGLVPGEGCPRPSALRRAPARTPHQPAADPCRLSYRCTTLDV